MPSPTTSPSFAEKQETLADLSQEDTEDIAHIAQAQVAKTLDTNGSDTDSPRPGSRASRRMDRDKEEVPFDFQKFLDQMKSKAAESVAKYLRS
jgi:hypothetical protein